MAVRFEDMDALGIVLRNSELPKFEDTMRSIQLQLETWRIPFTELDNVLDIQRMRDVLQYLFELEEEVRE